jgi:predicted NBD/HSP70 family sugar kinase
VDKQLSDASGYSFAAPMTSIRAINRARIISLIRRRPGVTRADLSRLSGLSKGTVSNHVAELLDKGFLHQDHQHDKRRRKTGLWVNRNAGFAIGIELSPEECRGVLTDAGISPLKRVRRRLDSTSVEETIGVLGSITTELLSDVAGQCLGLVIGVPGPTDARGQTLVFSESLGWSDVSLVQRLTERLPYSVTLINRARAGVLGERWHGAGVDVDELIYVSISSGIAAGILIGDQLFTGAYNYNGELGHTTILIDGPECVCGNRGCLETVASMPAIIHSIQTRLRNGERSTLRNVLNETAQLTYYDVIAAARDGDAVVVDEIRKASRYVGVAVANLIDLFNPRLVIIGGQLAEAGEIVVNTVRETAQRRAFPLSFSDVQIVKNALGADSVCIGACALVVDQYITQVKSAL